MTNETLTNMNTDNKRNRQFGLKLQAAREAMGFEQKDVAAQLRLSEKVIAMLESDVYPPELPTTFIRGYIRSYSKLLCIPEADVAAVLEHIKPKPAPVEPPVVIKQHSNWTSSHYYMQFSTYAIVVTVIGLVGIWWYNHHPRSNSAATTTMLAQSQTLAIPQAQNTDNSHMVTAENQSNKSPVTAAPSTPAVNSGTTTLSTPPATADSSTPHAHKNVNNNANSSDSNGNDNSDENTDRYRDNSDNNNTD